MSGIFDLEFQDEKDFNNYHEESEDDEFEVI